MIDCVVVGAGPAGLAASAALTERGVEHEVLERDRVGASWRTQRWDSFRLNTPGWANTLLGELPRDSYLTGAEVVERLDALAAACPVREGMRVEHLTSDGAAWLVDTPGGEIRAHTVVVATGHENVARTPALAGRIPARIAQFHAAEYRSPAQLPEGGVLVVGSAQSGCQITEDLLTAGREVVLATSPVGRAPTPYRGRDTAEWLFEAGFFDQRRADLPDPAMMRTRQPIVAPGGRSLSLQALARGGATLAGRLIGVDGEQARFDDTAAANVAVGDGFAARVRAMVDEAVQRAGRDAPPAGPDDAGGHVELDPPRSLDLRAVGSVVWCTGSGGDFGWLDPTLLDADGQPRHADGAAPAPGLHYVGLRWLTHRASATLPGMPKDAARAADGVRAHLTATAAASVGH